MTKHITLFKMLDKKYYLVNIDQNDRIQNNQETMEKVEKAIKTQEWYHLDEVLNEEWVWEAQADSVDYHIDELKTELERMDLPESFDIDEYIELHRDDIRDEIENRDVSNPLGDLIRHTPDIIMFYDLDVEIDQSYGEAEYKENYKAIKKALKLTKQAYKEEIDTLIFNAGNGGYLRIFFSASIEDMMKINLNCKKITFKNPEVCIHDSWNGSGMNENFKGLEITLPFNIENLRVEKAINGYDYTDQICGMSSNWADATIVNFK